MAPQPADEEAAGARGDRRDRRGAPDPVGIQLLALRRAEHPAADRGRGRRADGRRLLLRQRLAPVRRRADAAPAARPGTGRPAPTGCSRACCTSRTTCSRPSTAVPRCRTATSSRSIGSEGSLFVDDPWHCKKPGIELRRTDGVERIELGFADSYRLELENVSDAIRGDGELLLGREDALGQARTLEALHDDAQRG